MTRNQPIARELLRFRGTLDTDDFCAWVQHRALKLGLSGSASVEGAAVIADVTGPPELIDAMALCCSLGPASSWVEDVERTSLEPHHEGANGFQLAR